MCRVNDQFCNWVFSDWVRVKVLDIAEPGMNLYKDNVMLMLMLLLFIINYYFERRFTQLSYAVLYSHPYQACPEYGRVSPIS